MSIKEMPHLSGGGPSIAGARFASFAPGWCVLEPFFFCRFAELVFGWRTSTLDKSGVAGVVSTLHL
jgi:hypothetical protein